MIELQYCPQCGTTNLQWENNRKWLCSHCDFVLFHNVAGAVAVIITYEDEILFTRRNQEPKKGLLDLPGGFTDPKESAEETCTREINEELSISIVSEKLIYKGSLPNIYLYKNVLYNTLDLFFEYPIEDKFEVTLEESEINEVVWIKKLDINLDDIAFDSQKKFLRKYIIN